MRSYLDFEKPVGRARGQDRGTARHAGERRRCRSATRSAGSRPRPRRRCRNSTTISRPGRRRRSRAIRQRPHCLDYVGALITEFMPFAGDRKFGDDEAIVGGFGRFRGESICVIGQEKGSDHRKPAQAQFRHGAAGGLPQGGAADGNGRPLRHSGDRAGRHRRRLSRASAPRSAARPRRSRARPRPASCSACRTSR